VARKETKHYYNAHNFATVVSFGTVVSVHDGVDKIFVGPFLRAILHANDSRTRCSSNGRQEEDKRPQNSAIKVSFCTSTDACVSA